MAYTLQAFVGEASHLDRVELGEAVRRPLGAGMMLVPFTDRFRDVHGIPGLPLTDDRSTPEAILTLGAALSRGGMIAHVEAEYLGGAGAQAAIVWRDGQVVSGPSVGPGVPCSSSARGWSNRG